MHVVLMNDYVERVLTDTVKVLIVKGVGDRVLKWLLEEVKEPVLDEVERKYLSEVIRPFRKNVINICKLFHCEGNMQYISIQVRHENEFSDYVNLPNFKADTMYKGMKVNKGYSLEELGL